MVRLGPSAKVLNIYKTNVRAESGAHAAVLLSALRFRIITSFHLSRPFYFTNTVLSSLLPSPFLSFRWKSFWIIVLIYLLIKLDHYIFICSYNSKINIMSIYFILSNSLFGAFIWIITFYSFLFTFCIIFLCSFSLHLHYVVFIIFV